MAKLEKCSASLEDCIHYRRCFMSGEYCSRQANIQKERERLHAEGKINAFVIMDFSNMSTVVYNWRIKPFIESLKNYLRFEGDKICCYPKRVQEPEKQNETQVKQINVIRADTDSASNYVVCNRICQQMQIADLIIVDVSFENANVFYEFGMAVALGKLILPICYSESFNDVHFPEEISQLKVAQEKVKEIKHHIDCYSWRRTLFEHFGIRYKKKPDSSTLDKNTQSVSKERYKKHGGTTGYLPFAEAIKKEYGFSDMQYSRFPYLESVYEKSCGQQLKRPIGEIVYNRLRDTYNNSSYLHNTLVVYTLEGFWNEYQAGQCIINFYNNITDQMKLEHCFCGDRVGTLIQTNAIPEKDKDAKTEKRLLYNVGEIIHLGINEATFAAERVTIKPRDVLKVPNKFWKSEPRAENAGWKEELRTFTKGYIGNKSIPVYPKTPVYVKRILNGMQRDIFEVKKGSALNDYFCLYHVMLRTLKYTNELVVDISKTPLESLFWLGAAHGSNINTITVRHEESETERMMLTGSAEKKDRPIFDVVGLWSAILHSNDTDGFYRQLALAQKGIEQHSKLMLKNLPYYEDLLIDSLYRNIHEERMDACNLTNSQDRISRILRKKEAQDLESYYRDRFWKPMLGKEHLRIYLPQVDAIDDVRGEPKLNAVKWDVDAIATLSHYLSVRTHIGEYSFQTIGINETGENAEASNFITIGKDAKPLRSKKGDNVSLTEYVQEKMARCTSNHTVSTLGSETVHLYWEKLENTTCPKGYYRLFKGFVRENSQKEDNHYTQLPQSYCYRCMDSESRMEARKKTLHTIPEMYKEKCFLKGKKNVHTQLAQLVLWREVDRKNEKVWLWASLTGTSGPSTLALSTILVNESQRAMRFSLQKDDLAGWHGESEDSVRAQEQTINERIRRLGLKKEDLRAMEKPLSTLQEQTREKLMCAFMETLGKKRYNCINHPSEKNYEAFALKIHYSAVLYLSCELYRYFLPFLSLEDENKLQNGLHYFLFSLLTSESEAYQVNVKNGKKQNASKESQIIQETVDSLKTVLHQLQGVEALYQVKVRAEDDPNCDSRKSMCIRPLEGDSVSCLFVD